MTPRARFLASRTKCPACGAKRMDTAAAWFECGAVFGLQQGRFVVVSACQTRSQQAAHLWNQQTEKLHDDTPNDRL